MASYSLLPTWTQELCHAIESNDASLTKVTVANMENDVAIALADALAYNSTVTEIDLDLSFVHSDGMAALEDMLATNTSIQSVRFETCFNDNIHYPVPEARDEQGYTRAGIARGLVHNTSVTKLVVDGYGLDNEFWFSLSNREMNGGVLEDLQISRAQLPRAFPQYLMESSAIKRLHISESIIFTGDVANFVDSGLLCYALQSNKQRIVRISSVRVQHGVKEYEMPRVVSRFINIARFRKDVLYIERGFTSDCAVALAAKLKTNTTMKRLYLPDNPLGGVGVAALANMLETNTTLQMLDIGSVFIDDEKLATYALGKALMNNSTLVELRLANNCAVNFSHALAKALQVNTTLKTLDLASTDAYNYGAMALSAALEVNRTLRVLNLNDAHIGETGAVALAQMLLQNNTLKDLSLNDNRIEEAGTKTLLVALKDNYSLKSLTLDAPSDSLQEELDYWIRLSPTGRAMLTRNVVPSLIPMVLHRVAKDGKANSLFAMLSERPDLVLR